VKKQQIPPAKMTSDPKISGVIEFLGNNVTFFEVFTDALRHGWWIRHESEQDYTLVPPSHFDCTDWANEDTPERASFGGMFFVDIPEYLWNESVRRTGKRASEITFSASKIAGDSKVTEEKETVYQLMERLRGTDDSKWGDIDELKRIATILRVHVPDKYLKQAIFDTIWSRQFACIPSDDILRTYIMDELKKFAKASGLKFTSKIKKDELHVLLRKKRDSVPFEYDREYEDEFSDPDGYEDFDKMTIQQVRDEVLETNLSKRELSGIGDIIEIGRKLGVQESVCRRGNEDGVIVAIRHKIYLYNEDQ